MEIFNVEYKVEVLNTFEFTSERKRMSIIIKDGDFIKIYVKGADDIIKTLLNKNIKHPFLNFVDSRIDDLSKFGFRCLYIAYKIIEKKDYLEMEHKLKNLKTEIEIEG